MTDSRPRFRDLPHAPHAQYQVDVMWRDIEDFIEHEINDSLDLAPDFQRGHVWTDAQASAYVEYMVYGGDASARVLRFNCPNYTGGSKVGYVIVDGLQRLTAVRRFMRGEIPAYGHRIGDYADRPDRFDCSFRWCVLELPTRAEVLETYLRINTGGTPHAPSEIERVTALLERELARKEKDLT